MRFLFPALAATLLVAPAAAQEGVSPAPILTTPDARDVWTYARPEVARVTHVDLDLTADFQRKVMRGTATLDVLAAPGAEEIVLDTDELDIESVTAEDGRPLAWRLGADDPQLGAPLTVTLDDAERITVRYSSKPGASALQWLSPELTAGKQQPYLFSQGQPINNRSWIPTQDSPGIRQTWDATVTVPDDLVAVMSAEMLTPEGVAAGEGRESYRFRMTRPVPPYLIALAVGDLAFRELGPRSGVWTEPTMLDAAAYEFGDVEAMIDAAEALYGPYRWGRYDMLLLPPSFPYGGMENPMLTFLTPTLLTGDRSNTDVVAHELAHSWSGNLVTNATWSDSWLNEGFTTYFENRIMEALYGPERAAMYSDLDWDGLERDIEAAGGADAPTTRLHGEPGATFGQLDYFKGSVFLRTIENIVGRERFDAYLRGYFDRHAFQPQTTAGFLADIRAHLIEGDAELERRLQLDRWAYQPGLPENAVHVESATLAAVDADLEAFRSGAPVSRIDTQGWSTQEWLRFLNGLPRELPAERLTELDSTLDLSRSSNAYVRSAWLELSIANRYEPALPSLRDFTGRVGRGLLIRPLYAGLMEQGDWGKAIAQDLFANARATYHPNTAAQIERIITAPAQ
ncbi:M1 family metallopeptidase [Sphingosinithalassobacter sp. CS137]|uniref:M1 family metallopeptidase n=1 Tax=Sphingosinithalassobacter sp. CS137 TaxID=2762748 RepID=UPI00165D5FA8|nr:M1 family metallopeptidase [Sphingosinithalassobacter sp. CS137]